MVIGEILTWVTPFLAVIFGGTSFYGLVMYRKSDKRAKTAEAYTEEVNALKLTITTMQDQIKWLNGRLDDTQKMVVAKDVMLQEVMTDKNVLEIKNSKNKSAINRALACVFCDTHANCPVLIQRKAHEDEYLKRIEHNVESTSN